MNIVQFDMKCLRSGKLGWAFVVPSTEVLALISRRGINGRLIAGAGCHIQVLQSDLEQNVKVVFVFSEFL